MKLKSSKSKLLESFNDKRILIGLNCSMILAMSLEAEEKKSDERSQEWEKFKKNVEGQNLTE